MMLHVHAMVTLQANVLTTDEDGEIDEVKEILSHVPDSYFCFQHILCMN